jgi:hypothetical protein
MLKSRLIFKGGKKEAWAFYKVTFIISLASKCFGFL